MRDNSFRFKHFAIDQTGCAMKVNTDGALLGAWCCVRPEKDKVLLDIGTGTGLIALQLAQRTVGWSARIEAIEIDTRSALKARENFEASAWANRLTVNAVSLQEFAAETSLRFDHIISNPPYFIDSLNAPDPARNVARHATKLTYKELISLSVKLLAPEMGSISLIIPAGVETEKIMELATVERLKTTRLTEVYSIPGGGPKRSLIELSREATDPVKIDKLVIQDGGQGGFSAEYRELMSDFYLKF